MTQGNPNSTSSNGYPRGWSKLTDKLKDEAQGKCLICEEIVPEKARHTFQSHHLDHDRLNVDPENLLPACQRCHERLQRVKVTMGKTKFLDELRKVRTIPNYTPTIY